MKKILFLLTFIILIPTIIVYNTKIPYIYKYIYGIKTNKMVRVKRVNKNRIDNVSLENYVIGVVAGEMPASFDEEALKAQAVASRTYVLKKIISNKKLDYDVVDTTSNQVYLDEEDMKEKWNQRYSINKKKVENAVKSTKGKVVLYNNEIIDAVFFSTSNGYTENSSDVFNSNIPYLISVDSPWDKEESPVFSSTETVSLKEFIYNLNIKENYVKIGKINKTKTGRIKDIEINNNIYSADKIRKAFNLKSTSFKIENKNDQIIFYVKGYGHGVGMSQYGANAMAKKNYKYNDILKHYYSNCEIKKLF